MNKKQKLKTTEIVLYGSTSKINIAQKVMTNLYKIDEKGTQGYD